MEILRKNSSLMKVLSQSLNKTLHKCQLFANRVMTLSILNGLFMKKEHPNKFRRIQHKNHTILFKIVFPEGSM